MLTRLIYFSQVAELNGMEDIRQILKSSTKKNYDRSITGCLYFNEEYFVQVLEGDRNEVNQLYNKIQRDSRHKNLIITDVSSISSRNFELWSMLYLGDINVSKTELMKYSTDMKFNPSKMSSENILEFVLHLKSKVE